MLLYLTSFDIWQLYSVTVLNNFRLRWSIHLSPGEINSFFSFFLSKYDFCYILFLTNIFSYFSRLIGNQNHNQNHFQNQIRFIENHRENDEQSRYLPRLAKQKLRSICIHQSWTHIQEWLNRRMHRHSCRRFHTVSGTHPDQHGSQRPFPSEHLYPRTAFAHLRE